MKTYTKPHTETVDPKLTDFMQFGAMGGTESGGTPMGSEGVSPSKGTTKWETEDSGSNSDW